MAYVVWGFADQPNELNTSYHRVMLPAQMLQAAGHTCPVAYIGNLFNPEGQIKEALRKADVVVLERLLVKESFDLINKWRLAGKTVVATFDDNYAILPTSGGASFSTWRGGKNANIGMADRGALLNGFRKGLRLVTTAIVPSKLLADDYRSFCPSIQYVPNVPDLAMWDKLITPPRSSQIVIGWGGSSAHGESWAHSGIIPALAQICYNRPRVRVYLQSRDPAVLAYFARTEVRYEANHWVKFGLWPQVIKSFDIGVAPLSGEYDRRRSFLKAWEYALAGVPWVASNMEPYREAKGGLLVENRQSDWKRAIERLIDDPALREKLVAEGQAWARGLADNAVGMYETALRIRPPQ